MPTIQIPQKIPRGLNVGAVNGQKTAATVIDNIVKGCHHLVGARKAPIPLFCSPRTISTPYTFVTSLRREFYTRNATLYLTYSTYTYTDYWDLTLGDYTGTKTYFMQPTSTDTLTGSYEFAALFDIGGNLNTTGDLYFSIQLTFLRRDDFFKADPQQLTIYSAIIEVDDNSELTI